MEHLTPLAIIADLSARDVVLSLQGDSIEIEAPVGAVAAADVERLRKHKPEILAELRGDPPEGWVATPTGLIRVDFADDWPEDVDPGTVPVCPGCSRYCDTETVASEWRCSTCDAGAAKRKTATLAVLNRKAKIQAGNRRGAR